MALEADEDHWWSLAETDAITSEGDDGVLPQQGQQARPPQQDSSAQLSFEPLATTPRRPTPRASGPASSARGGAAQRRSRAMGGVSGTDETVPLMPPPPPVAVGSRPLPPPPPLQSRFAPPPPVEGQGEHDRSWASSQSAYRAARSIHVGYGAGFSPSGSASGSAFPGSPMATATSTSLHASSLLGGPGPGPGAGLTDVGSALTAAKLKEQLHLASRSNTQLALAAVSQEATMQELHATTQQLAAEKQQLAATLGNCERELAGTNAELQGAATRVSLLEAGAEACRHELQEVRARAQAEASEAARARSEAEQRAAGASAAVDAAKSRATTFSAEVVERTAELTQRLARSDAQANALADGAEKLMQEKSSLELALAAAQQGVSSANGTAVATNARVVELEAAGDRMRRELQELREGAERARQEAADARAAAAVAQGAANAAESRHSLDEEAAAQRARIEAERAAAAEVERSRAAEAERRRAADELASLRDQHQRAAEALRQRAEAAEAQVQQAQASSKAELQAVEALLQEARTAGAAAEVRSAQAASELNAARAEVGSRYDCKARACSSPSEPLTHCHYHCSLFCLSCARFLLGYCRPAPRTSARGESCRLSMWQQVLPPSAARRRTQRHEDSKRMQPLPDAHS